MAGTTKRFLVKVGGSNSAALSGFKPALASANLSFRPLFMAPAPEGISPGQGFSGASVGRAGTWFLAEPSDHSDTLAMQNELAGQSSWDLAHQLGKTLAERGLTDVQAIEPDLRQEWVIEDPRGEPGAAFAAAPSCERPEPQDGGALPSVGRFAWHLEDDFSGLKSAREAASGNGRGITIAHLDTGYFKGHKLLPTRLDLGRQQNFIDGEDQNDAHDPGVAGGLRNPGHGMGTLSILAGGHLSDMVPVPINGAATNINSGDFYGGAPQATIIPMRIANSVVHFSTSTVAEAIEAARRLQVDVISMSMGGLPSAAWADAVNAAYEAGIVIVCAAGNNFGGFPTSSIVYPARFHRVIAACGVMANDEPYFNLPPFVMQGCVGPRSKMATAMAAYTPNIPWARWGCTNTIDLDGAGTSAATPQIAAAAALWLTRHDARYSKGWMRVAAVRKALFQSAFKTGNAELSGTVDDFLGQGILAAQKALDVLPASESELEAWRSPPDTADFSLLRLITGLGVTEDPRTPLFELELAQIALTSKAAREAVPDPDLGGSRILERDRRRMLEAILDEGRTSDALRRHLENSLGRPSSTVVAAPAPVTPAGAVAGVVAAAPTAPVVERRTVRPPPKHRRLQIFATDPGASNRLNTAAVNSAIVKVPWEANGASANLLQEGPVGEYVEVVDVDPASGRVYEPVNLNDPFLLAQDGLPPSIGNPQFHQQMVYAVAMKTIEHFERALGRPVLWAPRRLRIDAKPSRTGKTKGVALPKATYEEIYVKRLRIYPHALRQANAFYSPDKAALLFGYFPDTRGNSSDGGGDAGGRIVFTCLSHDIVAHETTHAILDGLHRRYQEGTNPDVHAFHEALADLVAIFQHFTFPDVLAAPNPAWARRPAKGRAACHPGAGIRPGDGLFAGTAQRHRRSTQDTGDGPGSP